MSRWSNDDNNGDADIYDINEEEIEELHQQYRRLCDKGHSYNKNSRNVIREQKALINSLLAENEELQTDMFNADSKQNINKDVVMTNKMETLREGWDEYINEVKGERQRIKKLDEEIHQYEKSIRKEKITTQIQSSLVLQKHLRVLENRLEKSQIDFSSQLALNRNMRDQIDNLRFERSYYDNIHKTLFGELTLTHLETTKIIEECSHTYVERDELQKNMLYAKDRDRRDQAKFEIDLKELQRTVSHDEKLKAFMNIKADERAEYKAEEAAKRDAAGKIDKALDQNNKIISDYELAFQRIKEITKEEDLNIIVHDFITKEDDNFALFNYVNELSTNNELMIEQCDAIDNKIQKFKDDTVQLEGERNIELIELDKERISVKKVTEDEDEKLKNLHETLDDVKVNVCKIFEKITCDDKPVKDLLGGHGEIRDSNIMIYLGLMELRTNELAAYQQFLNNTREAQLKDTAVVDDNIEVQESDAKPSTASESPFKTLVERTKPAEEHETYHVNQYVIIPPTIISEYFFDDRSSDEEDADDRPFTREEILAKIAKMDEKKIGGYYQCGSLSPSSGKKSPIGGKNTE